MWDLAQLKFAWGNILSCDRSNIVHNPLYRSIDFINKNIDYMFDENHEAFEHKFSLIGLIAGVNIAYLPAVVLHHIGNISAYVLNNFTRPWELT